MVLEDFKNELARNPFANITELAYRFILDGTINASFPPGEKINANTLAEMLGVSRTPIRAALKQLAEDGYVVQINDKGYQVKPTDWSRCLLLYEARCYIESGAARIAANTITKKDLQILEQSISSLKIAKSNADEAAALAADHLFHETIINATKNSYLISIHNSLSPDIKRYQIALRYTEKYHVIDDNLIVDKHSAIFNAIKNSFSDVAAKEMENHIKHIYRILFVDALI